MLTGVVVISGKDSTPHQGVTLTVEGTVNLQLSAKSVGVFEAFYNSVKVRMLRWHICSSLFKWWGGGDLLSAFIIVCGYFARYIMFFCT